MSITLDYTSRITEIQPSRYSPAGLSFPIFESLADRTDVTSEDEVNECSTSSSSIGKNSDLSRGHSSDGEDDNEEVQSNYKTTFDSMDSLEEALPMRRGMSMFYDGKSKSYTSLAEASSSTSIKEIAKTENAFSRKRRNLNAFRSNYGGISKRAITSSKSTLALAVAMSSSESIMSSTTSDDSSSTSNSKSPSHLPPLYPRSTASHYNLTSLDYSPWRSYSVADLQHSAKIHR